MDNELPEGFQLEDSSPQQTESDQTSSSDLPEGFELNEDKYGTAGQQLKTAAEHAASSATFGLSTKAEIALGANPEDIRARTEENPVSVGIGEVGGLLVPGAPEAKLLGKAGQLGSSIVRGSGFLSKVGRGAVKGAIENALFQGGDEVSKSFSQDPDQSAETALTNIGLSSLIGGGIGGVFGAGSSLVDKIGADKFVDEFKSRINEHLTNPDLPTQTADNLSDFYNDTNKGSNSLFKGSYDETGVRTPNVKDQAVSQLVPQMNDKIMDKGIGDVTNHFMNKIEEMKADPDTYLPKFTKALEKDFSKWQEVANNLEVSSDDLFKATEDLKRNLQERSKIGIPIDNTNPAFDSVKSLKDSAVFLRKGLEDTDIWGEAGKFQRDTNQAYSKFLKPLKDFNQSFGAKVGGEYKIDPDKVQSYINQLSKEKGTIRSEKLQNYLDAADQYRDAINEAHEKIGVAGPFETKSADAVNTLTNGLTPGAKAADSVVKGLINHSAGDSAGAVGGILAGWPGYMVGKHVAGPILDSVVPSLLKPVLGSATSGSALRSALDYVSAFASGETAINKGVKNLFTAGKEVVPASLIPSEKDRSKLNDRLKDLSQNPEPMTDIGTKTAHYLPEHGQALAKTAANAVEYLNSQRPQPVKNAPLDTPVKPDPMAVSQYNRVLNVAQQPLTILSHIKDGSLQPKDVQALQALYPSLYQKLSSKIITEVSGVKDVSSIPYRTRIGMSLFIGNYMDSTMSPSSIIAAQPLPTSPPVQPKSKKPTAASAKAMNTATQAAMTPSQARSAERSQVKA